MKKSGNFLKIGILCWFLSTQLWAQVQLKAQVSTTQVGVNEQLILEYSINKEDTQQFKLPNLNSFEIVQGPSQSVSQSWINGKTSYMATYSYVLVPKKKGVLKIAPASLVYKGKKILSNAITITVSGNSALTKVPNATANTANNQQAKKSVHLVTVVNKEQLYVGEPMYVEYRLYMSNVGISINKFNKLGAYEGFWVHDFVDKENIRKETVYNGMPSVYYVLKRSLLIPQKDGKLTIQPMEANIAVEVPTNKVDFFGEVITKTVNQTYQSEQKIINVKSLPTKGKPANFNGAVGDFKMDFVKPKQPYQTNQSNLLAVKISGKGNFKLFDLPSIQTSATIETYTPEIKENLAIDNNGISGNVLQQFTLVPNQQGDYKASLQAFSFFNPADGKYHTLQPNQLTIKVIPGKNLPNTSVAIHPKNKTTNWFLWFSLVLLILMIVGVAIFWYFSKRKPKNIIEKVTEDKVVTAEQWLAQAAANLGDKNEFYSCLEKTLKTYLTSILLIEISDLNKEQIAEKLTALGIEKNVITKLTYLLNQCEMARYTPIEGLNMTSDYELGKELLQIK